MGVQVHGTQNSLGSVLERERAAAVSQQDNIPYHLQQENDPKQKITPAIWKLGFRKILSALPSASMSGNTE
jgi:hypothetical protein